MKEIDLKSLDPKDFKPLHDWVLVKKHFKDNKTSSGLITTTKEERPTSGEVLSVGEKVKNCKVGDAIVFHYAAGTTLTEFGEKLSIIKEVDIFGILEA